MYSLSGKVIAIVGAGGLIGRSLANAIAESGGTAVVADLNSDACEEVLEALSSRFPKKVSGGVLDITDRLSILTFIDRSRNLYGHIDAVVNCAYPRNANYGRSLEDVVHADFCENISLHLGGSFLLMQQFSLFFKQQGWGNIVNIASIYGSMAPRFEIYRGTTMTMPVEYAAIKAAIIQLTYYFAQYFKGNNIRVNCVSPGGLLDKQPTSFLRAYNDFCNGKGMLEPKDIGDAIIFLLTDQSRYIHGQNIVIDDGFQL